MKKGLYDQAIEENKEAVRIDPNYPWARYALGSAYVKLNRRDEALDEHKILKELDEKLANKLLDKIEGD